MLVDILQLAGVFVTFAMLMAGILLIISAQNHEDFIFGLGLLIAVFFISLVLGYNDTGSIDTGSVVVERNDRSLDVIAVEQPSGDWIFCVGDYYEENYIDCDFEVRLSRDGVEALLIDD